MPNAVPAMLWPDEQSFTRFREVCTDRIAPDHQTYVLDIHAKLARRGISEESIWKLAFDPDELHKWCLLAGCQVDAEGRARYAAFLADRHHRRTG